MTSEAFISGTDGIKTVEKLERMLIEANADVVMFSSAYVSKGGVESLNSALKAAEVEHCAGVFGVDDYVTQPSAIEQACDLGWDVYIAGGDGQNFHPKMAVAGSSIDSRTAGYVGSANFTDGGFENNIEVGAIFNDEPIVEELASIIDQFIKTSKPAGSFDLDTYADGYAERARQRSTKDTRAGVGEPTPTVTSTEPTAYDDWVVPSESSYSQKHATAAWTGLQSFTGEYKFQVEFPKPAAKAVRELVGKPEGEIVAYCVDDRQTRDVEYKFREDNGMFRLEIPNDVPGVERARREKNGICLVKQSDHPIATIDVQIINSEDLASEYIHRSIREGSWGKTSTRLYGWF